MFIAEARGLSLSASRPIAAAMSVVRAGSTHFTLRTSTYQLWATKAALVYVTKAAVDPAVDQATQADNWPGAYVPVGGLLEFQFIANESVDLPANPAVVVTGIRVISIDGTAGTFYLNEFHRKAP